MISEAEGTQLTSQPGGSGFMCLDFQQLGVHFLACAQLQLAYSMCCVELLSSHITLGGHCSMVCQVSSKHTSSNRIPYGMPVFPAQRHSSLLCES